jgi:hypothetical protein
VAKFTPDGKAIWARRFGDPANQGADGVATDAAGDVLVTGSMYGTVDFGTGTPLSASGSASDVFLAKLSP